MPLGQGEGVRRHGGEGMRLCHRPGLACAIGHQLAGWGIDLIHFPVQAQPGMVPAETIRNLGILYGPGISFIAGISLLFLIRYRLSRESIAEIQQALAQRRGSASSPS